LGTNARETTRINFLAHLILAAPTDASRVGNLLGDFVRGTPESLRGTFPDEVLHGIMMHRHLDRFTDDHPAFKSARPLLAPERRRFAGIIVDVVFDYFLTAHWSHFFPAIDLAEFIDDCYSTLERNPDWLTEDLRAVLPRMREENWLHSYGTLEGLTLTFQRISRRSRRTGAIAEAHLDFITHKQSFEQAFHAFFPDVQKESARLLLQPLLSWNRD
jgi:acyl carrier protein phosphodiesterase